MSKPLRPALSQRLEIAGLSGTFFLRTASSVRSTSIVSVRPEAAHVEIALVRARSVDIRQSHLVPGVQVARPALRGPGLVQGRSVPYLRLSQAMKRWRSAFEYDTMLLPLSLL